MKQGIKDKEGKTAVDHSIAGNHKEITTLLTTALTEKKKKEGTKKEDVLVFELDEIDDNDDVASAVSCLREFNIKKTYV
jgi:hypothetical protein